MFHFDQRLITIFGVLFVGLGVFNLVLGRNRMRQASAGAPRLPWYRQMSILTGIEYILLGIVLLLNAGISMNFFPENLARLIVPLYTIVLLLAALVLAAMLLQGLRGNRPRVRPTTPVQAEPSHVEAVAQDGQNMTAEQRTQHLQRRRERRQKAAAARRRQSGRA